MSGRDERGAIAILTAVFASLLFVVAALVVDLGLARDVRGQSQHAADASALAAGNALYTGADLDGDGRPGPAYEAAVSEAVAYASRNFDVPTSAWGACTDPAALDYVPVSQTPCVSFDSAARPTQIRVRIPTRAVETGFGTLLGVDEIPVASEAVAALDPGITLSCSLCVLGEGPHDVSNGDITVTGSSVHFNGSVYTGPNGHVTAEGHRITVEGTATGNFAPAATSNAGTMGDPLASLDLPLQMADLQQHDDPCSEGPGIYGSVSFDKGTCTLRAGLYVVTGTWSLKNNTELTGDDVTIYATCATGGIPRPCQTNEQGGAFDAKNGDVRLTGDTATNLAIVYDRQNVSDVSVQGNGETDIRGTIYAASARLYANGNSGNGITNGSIVVDTIYLNGQNSHLQVTNGFDQTWQLPPGGLHLHQ